MNITYVKAVFGSLRKTRTQPVYRDDHDLILQLVGVKGLPVHFQAHFANSEYGTAIVMMGSDGEVSIPNTLLATGLPVYCWILVEQGISGAVRYSVQIPVRQKARPDGTIPPEQADIISQAISALNDAGTNAQEAADSAEQNAEYITSVKSDLDDAIDRVGVLEEAKDTTLEAASNAEAWAVGNRGGSAVPSTDPAYHNNAKYYAEQAAESARTLTLDSTLTQLGQAADAKAAGDIKENLSIVCPTPETTWILKRNVDGTGNITTNNYMALTYAIPVSVGDLVRRKVPSYIDNKGIIGYLSEFNGTTFIRRSSIDTEGQTYIITDPTTTEIRLSFGRVSASGITITQEDVDAYFKFEIYRKAVTFLDGLVNRGAISNLGYTSIGQCTKQGFYTFGSSDSLSDLPTSWTGGGLILVYKNGNVIWQRLVSLKYRFVRYGTTVEWRNEATLVYAQYIAESGENQSDAKLNVFVPRDLENRRTLYQMGHCVNADANADVWRIMFAYRVDTNGTQRKLTMTGEWECALHLDGRSDFSGGIVHGDEVDTDIKVFVDGTLTNIASLNTYCNELKIVRHSNLYDPNDSTTVIAEHGVEYIYTNGGLKINQSIKWRVAETLTNCFLAMLPIIKVYSKYRYDDTGFDIVENDQTKYSVTIPNAKSVTEYSTDYDCVVQMSIPVYPTGLTGGDCALVTDNGGLNYNKAYFPVCTSGTSQIGELWKSTTVYRNK